MLIRGEGLIKAFRIITVALLISWMAFIFSLSSQNSNASSNTSGRVIRTVAQVIYPDFEELSSEEQQEVISSFQFIVRKTAHFSLYFILGFLAFMSTISYRKLKLKIRALLSYSICLLYAVSDEVHQLFVAGRSGEIRDVLIDFSGAFLAVLILTLLSRYIKRIYKHISFKEV